MIATIILILTPTIYSFFQAKFTDNCATTSTGICSYNASPMSAIIHINSLVDQTSEVFDQIMNVNVKGVWLSMKYEIPEMIRTGGGAIVNNSSVAGIMGFPQMAIYIASKHAVLGLTKSAALEYAKSGIRINAIAPGGVETEMANRVNENNPQFLDYLTSMHPIGRIADPEEIANAVVWLLSEKASFVLGHTLIVDGGAVSR